MPAGVQTCAIGPLRVAPTLQREEGRPVIDEPRERRTVSERAREEALVDELARLYERGLPRYLRVASAITGDAELARDAVQDAFASALRGCLGYRAEGPLEAWVWRAIVNTARNHRRRALHETPDGRDRPDPGYVPYAASDDSRLRELIAALPERQRLTLFLRYYADLDYEAIAQVLSVRSGTVGATLNAAHAALRPALEEEAHSDRSR
jgi:RNA polymerase sigma-70 factor (ECF subfamily)